MKGCFTRSQLRQVQHIATDAPSGRMLSELRSVCPRLRSLELDACHIVMVYEACQWKKKQKAASGYES